MRFVDQLCRATSHLLDGLAMLATSLACSTPPYHRCWRPAGRDVSSAELRALVEACIRDQGTAGARDLAILAVLYIGGLRRSELVALEVADFRADPKSEAR